MDPLKKIFVVLIVLVTLFTRFYRLDSAPPHLSNDEISIAYDAYSLARTGGDEYGNFLPLSFPSHGTFKAPLYAYTLAPLTLVFKNSSVTARLPSAIAGSLTVLFVILLAYELTGSLAPSLWSGLILAATPWHIYTSRMALEANLALLFLCIGIWAVLRGLSQKNWILYIGFISLAVAMYGYHTEWGLVPLLVVGFFIFYRRQFWRIFLAAFILFAVCLPLGLNFVSNLGTTARANTEIIWKDGHLRDKLSNFSVPVKFLIIGKTFASNYLDYISPGPLFYQGLGLFNSGHIYIRGLWLMFLLPFFILGLVIGAVKPSHARFFWWWLLITPVVPALTHGGFNHVRYLVAVIPFTIVIALGWNHFFRHSTSVWRFIAGGLFANSFVLFCFLYYQHFPIHSGLNYQYGYRQAAEFFTRQPGDKTIVVDSRFGDHRMYVGVPHLYLAYFMELDPALLPHRIYDTDGMHFGSFTIKEIDWTKETLSPRRFYLVPESNLPPGLQEVYKINLPDGTAAFRIYQSSLPGDS